jgi:hypothetical protein
VAQVKAKAAEVATPPQAARAATYRVSVRTHPSGAQVIVHDRAVTAPGELSFEDLPARVRVIAQKDGYQPTSIRLDRASFTRVKHGFRRKLLFNLQPAAGGDAPTTADADGAVEREAPGHD